MRAKQRDLHNVNAVIQRGRDILALFDEVERKHHTSGAVSIQGFAGVKRERRLQSLPRTPGAARRSQVTTLGEVRGGGGGGGSVHTLGPGFSVQSAHWAVSAPSHALLSMQMGRPCAPTGHTPHPSPTPPTPPPLTHTLLPPHVPVRAHQRAQRPTWLHPAMDQQAGRAPKMAAAAGRREFGKTAAGLATSDSPPPHTSLQHSQIILRHNIPFREREAERKKLAALSEAA